MTTAAVNAERTKEGEVDSFGTTKHTPERYVISVSVVNWSTDSRTSGAVIGTGAGPNLASKFVDIAVAHLPLFSTKKRDGMGDTMQMVRDAGQYVVVEAVPGAGKTHMIVALAQAFESSLILAYNNALASEIQSLIDPERVQCYTFHSLCSRCLGVVRDDLQLLKTVEEVEQGSLTFETDDVPVARALFIDEAQDVRPVYIRLLKALGLIRGADRIYVFGDRNQLIYDYDPNFPACLDVLTRPNAHVRKGVAWNRVVASVSRRLPPSVASLVSDLFGVTIKSDVVHNNNNNNTLPPPMVEVRTPTSMFRLAQELRDLKEVPHLLLVDRRRKNGPLRALLNEWSREGVMMNVHRETEHNDGATMTCATYWSAKGLQHDTVVVIVPEQTPRNPLYVALTRTLRRLILVVDPKAPHAALCQAIARHPDTVTITSQRAARAIESTRTLDPAVSLSGRKEYGGSTTVPDHRVGTSRVSVPISSIFQDDTQLPGDIVVAMALAWTEIRYTGACRLVDEVLQPLVIEWNQDAALRAHGYIGRPVYSKFKTEDMLLSPDLRTLLRDTYDALRDVGDGELDEISILNLYELAYVKRSYDDGFECVTRQRSPDPVITPFDRERIEWVRNALSRATEFDVPTSHSTSRRVHARGDGCSYHVVAQSTSDDVAQAAMRCEEGRSCVLVDVEAWSTTTVSLVEDA